MRTRALLAATAGAGLLLTVQQTVAGPGHRATAEATVGPLACGTTSYHAGTFVWTDYAYDDHGPNTSSGTAGAASYPDASDQSNAADLVQLQASFANDGALIFRAVLETLTKPDEPLLGIGLDVDGDTGTGAASVPGGAWHNQGALGLDAFVTASSDGGQLSTWSNGGWHTVAQPSVRIDTDANTITTTVDTAALNLGDHVHAVAVLGLRRASASWQSGNGPIYDLAFVHAEEPTTSGGMLGSAEEVAASGQGHATGGEWQDVRQADVLSGHLPSSDAVDDIDLAAMRAGVTSVPSLDAAGYHVMLYRSHVVLPEGIVDGTAAGGLWAGPYQPYLVQLPARPRAGLPLLVWLHGGGQDHLDNGTFAPQGPMSIGDSVTAFPYGRETTTANDHGYNGVSEQDVLDVIADTQRLFATDPDRTVIGGVSTGGGGASRLAQLHPDLFSGLLVMSAYDDTHLPENLVNLPVDFQNGMADPAASQPVLALTIAELDQLRDVDYRSYSIAAHSHADPVAPLSQCLLDSLLQRRIVRDPARVVLGLDPNNDPTPTPAGLDLRHDRAYWISGVTVRPGAMGSVWHTAGGNFPGYGDNAVATVDATTLGVARRSYNPRIVETVGQNITAGSTLCGSDDGTTTNDVWHVHGIALDPAPPEPTSNAMSVTLRNVATATFDLPRMHLTGRTPLTITATGDGPAVLRLHGDWTGAAVNVTDNGQRVAVVRPRDGILTVNLDLSGDHTIRITR